MATGPFGSSISSKFFRPSGVPVIRGGNLSADSTIRLNDRALVFLDPEKRAEFMRSTVRRGDLIFTSWGTINQIGLIDESAGYDMYIISNKQMKLTPDPSIADAEFLYYLFSSPQMQREILDGSIGSSIPGFNLTRLRSLTVNLPPLPEQKRVALALATAEGAEVGLSKAINKKQAVKQGMIQQLLTGLTRLPGFTDPWLDVRLRDVGSTYGGLTGKTKDDFGKGSASFVTFMEVIAAPRLLGERLECVNVRSDERQNRVQQGDILFNGSSETPEEVALAAVVDFEPRSDTFLNSFCFGYRVKRNDLIDPAYLAYFFRSDAGRMLVASLAQGATRYNIAKTKLLDLSLVLPPVDEQRAIVAMLRDCEDEINVLTQRLAKARGIRQGMMQELLTGRTRLPVREAAA